MHSKCTKCNTVHVFKQSRGFKLNEQRCKNCNASLQIMYYVIQIWMAVFYRTHDGKIFAGYGDKFIPATDAELIAIKKAKDSKLLQ